VHFGSTLTADLLRRGRSFLGKLPAWMKLRWATHDGAPPPPHIMFRPTRMIRWMCRREVQHVRPLWADGELRTVVRAAYLRAIVRLNALLFRKMWPAVAAAVAASGIALVAIVHILLYIDPVTVGALLKQTFDPETTIEKAAAFIGTALAFVGSVLFLLYPGRSLLFYYISSAFVAAAGLIGIVYWSDIIPDMVLNPTKVGLAVFCLVTSFLALYVGFAFAAALWILSRLRKGETDSLLVRYLVRLLYRCEGNSRRWYRLNFRIRLSRDILRIADLIEGPLRRRFAVGGGLNTFIDSEFHKIAASFRSKVIQIAGTGANSHSEVTASIRRATLAVASGAWDALDRSDMLSPARRSMFQWTLVALRWFIVAVGPRIGVYVLQQTHLKLQPPTDSFAALAVVGWFLISCFSAIDPLYKDKVASVKEIVGLLSRGKP
jgi:hypothetical protein